MDKSPIEQAREAQVARYRITGYDHGFEPAHGGAWVRYDDHVAALASLSPTTPVDGVGAEPHVKPLEWQNVRVSYGPETYEAKTPVGFYQVFVDEGSAAGSVFAEWAWDQSHFGMTGATSLGRYATFPAAEAAAQADYERRILSALNPQSAAGEEGKC